MPRDIPVGNGDLLITFDHLYRVRDLYYPLVGRYNHTGGHVQRFGVWADGGGEGGGQFAWVEDGGWERELRYKPDTLVTEVRLRHAGLGLALVCHDVVDFHEPVYLRRVTVTDLVGAGGGGGDGGGRGGGGRGMCGCFSTWTCRSRNRRWGTRRTTTRTPGAWWCTRTMRTSCSTG